MRMRQSTLGLLIALSVLASQASSNNESRAQEGPLGMAGFRDAYADSDGVKIHYVVGGSGPLVVMLHGFPDFWYTWRRQMPALAQHFQVAAIDQRGYNLSDQPRGVSEYSVAKLVGDLDAVVRDLDRQQVILVGHDWGGMVAWSYAMRFPQKTRQLVILNLPHPAGLLREMANNAEQQANSQYARDFQQPDAAGKLTPEKLASWVKDQDARPAYLEAFRRSSFEGMLNYYKANYPASTGGQAAKAAAQLPFPKIQCPVLQFHGLEDQALVADAVDGTWKWVAGEWNLVTIPGAGHFVQHDAAELVTRRMLAWLSDNNQ